MVQNPVVFEEYLNDFRIDQKAANNIYEIAR